MAAHWHAISARAREEGVGTAVTISAACGCPFEGRVEASTVREIAAQLAPTEPDELIIADTIGVGVPSQVSTLFNEACAKVVDLVLCELEVSRGGPGRMLSILEAL